MRPGGTGAAPETDVLPHVEPAAREFECREVAHEAVDQGSPAVPIGQRTGTDVDLRIPRRIRGGSSRAVPQVIIRMQVEDQDVPVETGMRSV